MGIGNLHGPFFQRAGSAGAARAAGHRMAMSAAVGVACVRCGTVRFASIHVAPVRRGRPGRGTRPPPAYTDVPSALSRTSASRRRNGGRSSADRRAMNSEW